MKEKMPIDLPYTGTATGGTYDYVESDVVPPGEIWCVQRHSFENETGARGTARGFIGTKDNPRWIWEEPSLAADELAWDDRPVYITEGNRIGVRQASCTSGDKLKLYIFGYLMHGRFVDGED